MFLEKQNIIFAQSPEEQAALEAEAIKSEDVKKDPERQQKSTPGVGTDIFIRKKKPGSQVGKGYFVDIYENGVKIDTIELTTKKDVTKLIRKFKDKYNTDRAFQNEMQVHITYKTKKERGEPTMASIDTILLKKAHKIQELLHRITEPELPLIKRFGQDDMLGDVTSVPETPPSGMEDKEKIKRYIADEINKKYTSFVKDKSMAGYSAIDDIFNPLRKWYGTLSKKIKEWNNMSNNMLNDADIKDITSATGKILLSKDVNLIKKNTGIDISPEVANLMYEVGSKSVGKPGEAEKGGELGGNPADFNKESSLKIAKEDKDKPTIENTNDLLQSFTKSVQTQISSTPIIDIAKDLNVVDKDILQKMHSILSEKDNLVEAETAIKKYIEEYLNLEKKSSLHPSIIESETKEFWKFAGEYRGIANIEDVFVDWVNKMGCSLEKATNIWEKVNKDIVNIFSKKAGIPDFEIEEQYKKLAIAIVDYLIAQFSGLDTTTSEQEMENKAQVAVANILYPILYDLIRGFIKNNERDTNNMYNILVQTFSAKAERFTTLLVTHSQKILKLVQEEIEIKDIDPVIKDKILNHVITPQFLELIKGILSDKILTYMTGAKSIVTDIAQPMLDASIKQTDFTEEE